MRKLQIVLPLLLLSLIGLGQQKLITGKVIDKVSNQPLPGVTVENHKKTVTTDAAGAFSIEAAPGDVLFFSFVGMNPQKIRITAETSNLVLVLEEGSADLNTVVVTGYKSEKKADLTGAVSVVNLANVKNNPVASPMLALQGQVPGLYISG